MWVQMAWAFLCDFSPTLDREAMLGEAKHITSFDKYDTCQKLDISQYKLFMEQLYVSKHNAAFKEHVVIQPHSPRIPRFR